MKRLLVGIALLLIAAACSPSPSASATLPPGDAAHGAELFTQQVNGAPACSTCHTLDGSTIVGPSLQGYAGRASTRVQNQSAQDYTYTSITQPAAFIVEGFGNVMYTQYGQRLSAQETADLTAYLLTLS
jgi:cytochrome c oxidase subunit II